MKKSVDSVPSKYIQTPEHKEKLRTNARAPKRTRFEKEQILEKIRQGILASVPPRQLIKELAIPQSTFYGYLDEIHQDTFDERLKKREMRLLGEYQFQIENTCHELYVKFQETNDTKYLVERAKIINDSFERLQSAGFIPKVKEKIESTGEVKFTMEITRRDKNGNKDQVGSQ